MKKIIDRLQKITDEGQRPKGSEERRYFILDANSALEKISNLIVNSRKSITAMLDPWGMRLFSQCKTSLVKAVTNAVHIRVICGAQCIGNESLLSLPEGVDLKISPDYVSSNVIIVDTSHIISVDGNNGKAALFMSVDSFGMLHFQNFEEIWSNAREVKPLLELEPTVAIKAMELAKIVDNGLAARILEYTIKCTEMPPEVVNLIDEKFCFKIAGMVPSEVINLVDSALRISCMGNLKYDHINNIISLQSKIDGKHILPWALVLMSYFRCIGNEPRIIQHSKQSGLHIVHLRLSKPILISNK
jgi:hypothetical protein